MTMLLVILCIICGLSLCGVRAVQPRSAELSWFELRRRTDSGDRRAERLLWREQLLPRITSLQQVTSALLVVLVTLFSVLAFGYGWGVVIALVIVLLAGTAAQVMWLRRQAQALYEKSELSLLDFCERTPWLFRLIGSTVASHHKQTIDSREEFIDLVERSGNSLSHDEKQAITAALAWDQQRVKTVMTPRRQIDSISKSELLGPLVLHDLHTMGHQHFPVTSGDLDHIVGMLHVRDLLSLDKKRSLTAEKTMEARVYYIHEDDSLEQSLMAFLQSQHQLLVVINSAQETVGLLSLGDVIRVLLGRTMRDEFDAYDDRRAVASRHGQRENRDDD